MILYHREKESFESTKAFIESYIDLLPEKIHWKVYLELADLAKRENRLEEARELFKKVTVIQPYASQGWLEYSKVMVPLSICVAQV